MKSILSTLGQAFRKSILAVCLMSLISLTGIMILPGQPAYAAIVDISSNQTKTGSTIEGFSKDNTAVVNRDQAYEEAVKATEQPKVGIEKVYEQDLHAYQEENPPESILEKAEEAIDKITAQPR